VHLSDARVDGDQAWIVVALEPGSGAALIVVDAENLMGGANLGFASGVLPARGLASAEVRVREQTVGRSDASGLAIVTHPGHPGGEFEVSLQGWSVLSRHPVLGPGQLADDIGFVLMVRE
jgi:hypothetical protein